MSGTFIKRSNFIVQKSKKSKDPIVTNKSYETIVIIHLKLEFESSSFLSIEHFHSHNFT